jgi:hypothetical protein
VAQISKNGLIIPSTTFSEFNKIKIHEHPKNRKFLTTKLAFSLVFQHAIYGSTHTHSLANKKAKKALT